MRTTPKIMTGSATSTSRRGRSPHRSQATAATMTTWRLPITVASPAPMLSIDVVQNVSRSAAKKTPARAESRIVRAFIAPSSRRSNQAARSSSGRPYRQRKTTPVAGLTPDQR